MSDILIVGGTFDNNGGKPSKVVSALSPYLGEQLNGGYLNELEQLNLSDYKCVVWMPNIDNKEDKILPTIKKKYPTILLVQSKRCIEKWYEDSDVIGRLLKSHAGLGIKIEDSGSRLIPYQFKLLDPLGNIYADTSCIPVFGRILRERIDFILSLSRVRSHKIDNKLDFNIPDRFIDIIKDFGDRFSKYVNAINPNRFLGNAATRCSYGFPAVKISDRIFVTRRNVDKQTLTGDDFVEVYQGVMGEVSYYGDHKPSVDTPVQLRLFETFPNINYMIHGHVYVKGAPMTSHNIPCGFVEEFDDILNTLTRIGVSANTSHFVINLKGHGCIIACKKLDYFDNIKLMARPFPEE